MALLLFNPLTVLQDFLPPNYNKNNTRIRNYICDRLFERKASSTSLNIEESNAAHINLHFKNNKYCWFEKHTAV